MPILASGSLMILSSKVISPLVVRRSPAILLSNVDFPVPDCPIILKNSFVLTVKSIFSRTFKCSECPSISNSLYTDFMLNNSLFSIVLLDRSREITYRSPL